MVIADQILTLKYQELLDAESLSQSSPYRLLLQICLQESHSLSESKHAPFELRIQLRAGSETEQPLFVQPTNVKTFSQSVAHLKMPD